MSSTSWIHDPLSRQTVLQSLLQDLKLSLSTEPAHWREEPMCSKLLKPYEDFCSQLAQVVCDAYIQAIRYAVHQWVQEPGRLPKAGDLEDYAMSAFQSLLQDSLPELLAQWFPELNRSVSGILRTWFTRGMIDRRCRPVLFPGLYMGQWQQNYTHEIAYDMVVMVHKRLCSCNLSGILSIRPLPQWMQPTLRRRTFRKQEGELELLLNEEKMAFRYDYEVYLLSREFLLGYKACILEDLQQWVCKPDLSPA